MSRKHRKQKNRKSEELKMTFDPNTIEHLGVRMYSALPPIIAELVANSYDADANNVYINMNDTSTDKEITVIDDGIGMSFKEINDKFLHIGRNRRTEEKSETTPGGRKIIGKKGLGKLSFFGIADEIEISAKKDGKENVFLMIWDDIKKEKHDYKPEIIKHDMPCPSESCGTTIMLKKIKRKTDFLPKDLASSLSKIFITDPDFRISIKHNSNEPELVSNELRYADLEVESKWTMPEDFKYEKLYEKADKINGCLIATKKPIPPKTKIRGITLFSRKKLVNLPEYFSDSTSSHFFSYLTGWLEVDFIDDLQDDVIATNRQSLNWEHDETKKLREYLRDMINWLERDWREKRKINRRKKISESSGINIKEWLDKLPDNFRKPVEAVIDTLIKDSELPERELDIVKKIHDIVPEYPLYHWRSLHPKIQSASETYYQNEDYYGAFQEAVKEYVYAVREKSNFFKSTTDFNMMRDVFGCVNENKNALHLLFAQNFNNTGKHFSPQTINNIESGQKYLSMGAIQSYRNPLSHETIIDLKESGLFTENDCLDALSLLSYLFNRLDQC